MKITILEKHPEEDDEIIVKCGYIDEEITKILNQLRSAGKTKMNFYKDSKINLIEQNEIFYFESVDDKVFAYTKDDVFETKQKLYTLEEELPNKDFFRANKAVIVNLNKIQSLSPAFGGRYEAVLKNGYKVIVSRSFVNDLKKVLGL